MPKFECHITCHARSAARVEQMGELVNWKFSKIDGDALMGDKPYCYLTQYKPDQDELLAEAHRLQKELDQAGIEVLRLKIERIIFDSKTGINEITK